jgi:hypothetical protein
VINLVGIFISSDPKKKIPCFRVEGLKRSGDSPEIGLQLADKSSYFLKLITLLPIRKSDGGGAQTSAVT